jgi:V/A-type H+-transporting ATPase subunit G/H
VTEADAHAKKTVTEADAHAEKTITEADAHADRRTTAADVKLAELHRVHRALSEQFTAAQEAVSLAVATLTPLDEEAVADEKAADAPAKPADAKPATKAENVDPSEQPTTQLPVPKGRQSK